MSKWRRPIRFVIFLLALWLLFLFTFSSIYPIASRVREISHDKISSHHSPYLTLQQIPHPFQMAMINTEDRRFYSHFGIDIIGVIRSLFIDLMSDRLSEGGSTITQQLIRNTLLTPEKTFTRKISEAILAIALECFMSKQEILELYFNVIYFGHGAYGAEQAAQTFFGKPLSSLELPEWAMLAGLPNSPSDLDPYLYMDKAKQRQKEVLDNMVDTQEITQQEEEDTLKFSIKLKSNAVNRDSSNF